MMHASIYLETPSGVGFSYSLNGNYTTGDADTAASNLKFLEGFFAACTARVWHHARSLAFTAGT